MNRDEALDAFVSTLTSATPSSLPRSTVDAARRVVADCLVCGLAGAPFQRSETLRAVLEDLGGAPQATVLGSTCRLPAPLAAAANAEAMNLLDADDSFLSGPHNAALVVPAALAEAEASGSSWGQFLLGVVVGFEATARMAFARPGPAPMFGAGLPTVGAAIAAAVAAGGDRAVVEHTIGLAMRVAPSPVPISLATGELRSTKYAPYGAIATQAVLAARLARAGYTADHRYLVSDPGFFHVQGVAELDVADVLLREAATGWWIEETSLKPYPSFRLGHPAVDLVRELAAGADGDASAIDRIDVWLDPRTRLLPFLQDPPARIDADELAPVRTAMHMPYTLALAALGVPPGPRWCAPDTLRDAAVWTVADRVVVHSEPACTLDDVADRVDARSRVTRDACARARVTIRGEQREAERWGSDGDPWHPDRRPDWAWLARKAASFGVDPAVLDHVREAPTDASVRLDAVPMTSAAR